MTRGFLRFLRGNTIALIALFLALGGTTYAAVSLPANSVGAKQLKKNAVINKKIKANAVTGGKVKNDSLTGADVVEGSLGTVPSATNATHATSADSATNATNATTAANANKLGGLAANQLVRATAASAGNTDDPCGGGAINANFQGAAFTNLVSKAVTAPVAGVLVITGRIASEFSSGTGPGTIRLLGRLAVDGAQSGPQSETSLSNTSASCGEGRTLAMTTAVAVTAGNHTVAVQAKKSTTTAGTGGAYIGNAAFSTVFVPFGNAGTQGVLAPQLGPKLSVTSNR